LNMLAYQAPVEDNDVSPRPHARAARAIELEAAPRPRCECRRAPVVLCPTHIAAQSDGGACRAHGCLCRWIRTMTLLTTCW